MIDSVALHVINIIIIIIIITAAGLQGLSTYNHEFAFQLMMS